MEINTHIRDWLKYAKDREGGRAERAKRKKERASATSAMVRITSRPSAHSNRTPSIKSALNAEGTANESRQDASIGLIAIVDANPTAAFPTHQKAKLRVHGRYKPFLLDTGATANLFSTTLGVSMVNGDLDPILITYTRLSAVNNLPVGSTLNTVAKVLRVSVNKHKLFRNMWDRSTVPAPLWAGW